MDKQRVYLNSFSSRISGSDFLLFAALLPDAGRQIAPEDAEFEVFLSPHSMKLLYEQLGNGIKMYELLYGPIQMIPDQKGIEEIQNMFPAAEINIGNKSE